MASIPSPEPDYGPVDDPQPTSPPAEMPPMPGDLDNPAPIDEPMAGTPMQASGIN